MAESTASDADILRKRKEMEPCEQPEAEGLSESSESNNGEDDNDAGEDDNDAGEDFDDAARAAWIAEHTITDPAWLNYQRELTEYEGFYITYDEALWKRYILRFGPCLPASERSVNKIKAYANLAIERFNQTEGGCLELKELVRANMEITGQFVLYVTFEATNRKFYETKFAALKKHLVEFYFLRVAKYHPNLGSSPSEGSS